MIKEFWKLAKMLFSSNPSEVDKVVLMGMNHIPFKGYKYIMWCGHIIYRNDKKEEREKEWKKKTFRIDENHETIHLMQAKTCGSWKRYYWSYFKEWMKGNPVFQNKKAVYYTNPYESEAYANEENLDYCKNYDGSNLPKYRFKNRISLYFSVGGTGSSWKKYVKTL